MLLHCRPNMNASSRSPPRSPPSGSSQKARRKKHLWIWKCSAAERGSKLVTRPSSTIFRALFYLSSQFSSRPMELNRASSALWLAAPAPQAGRISVLRAAERGQGLLSARVLAAAPLTLLTRADRSSKLAPIRPSTRRRLQPAREELERANLLPFLRPQTLA